MEQKVMNGTKGNETEEKVMKWNKKQRNGHCYMATLTKSNETGHKVVKRKLINTNRNKKQ